MGGCAYLSRSVKLFNLKVEEKVMLHSLAAIDIDKHIRAIIVAHHLELDA